MDIKELKEKIDKKLIDIEKRKNITLKMETKLATLTDEYDIKWAKDDIKSSNYKLKDLETQLENLHKQVNRLTAQNHIKRIPVIEEFLEAWKVKAIEWYKRDYNRLLEYLKKFAEHKKEMEVVLKAWKIENGFSEWTYNKAVREKEKEFEIDNESYKKGMKWFSGLTLKLYENRNEWETYLEKEIEKDKNNKRALFIDRVEGITGTITDASLLSIGGNGEINGIVTGEKGKAKVETISAGGYNIQCWHFRVLVHEYKQEAKK
jgi:hypothetical protein